MHIFFQKEASIVKFLRNEYFIRKHIVASYIEHCAYLLLTQKKDKGRHNI